MRAVKTGRRFESRSRTEENRHCIQDQDSRREIDSRAHVPLRGIESEKSLACAAFTGAKNETENLRPPMDSRKSRAGTLRPAASVGLKIGHPRQNNLD
jgi:hypothetical protein